MKKPVTWNIDIEIIDEINRMSKKAGIPASQFVNTVLKAGMDSQREMISALQGISLDRLLEVLTAEGRKKKKK